MTAFNTPGGVEKRREQIPRKKKRGRGSLPTRTSKKGVKPYYSDMPNSGGGVKVIKGRPVKKHEKKLASTVFKNGKASGGCWGRTYVKIAGGKVASVRT